jgi:hypothetical protein
MTIETAPERKDVDVSTPADREPGRRGFLKAASAGVAAGGALSLLGGGSARAATGSATLTPASSSDNLIVAQSASVTPLTLQGASGQSANLQEWQDAQGNVVARIDPSGRLKIIADGSGGRDLGTLVLDNRTVGANPAEVATIGFNKDHTARWMFGFDQTPGSIGDFDLFHYGIGDPANGRDVLYVTDEVYPKVSINGDRYTPATFTLYNLTDRPAMVVSGSRGQVSDLAQWWRYGDIAPTFSFGASGLMRLQNATYRPTSGDAPTRGGFLYNLNGQLSWLSSDGAITTLGPDPAIADGRNISFGTTNGTKIGTAANQKLAFFNATPVTQPVLSFSRSGSKETAAGAALRGALSALGLVSDQTTA